MEQMDMKSMILPLALKFKLPIYINKLGGTDDKGNLIAMKQYMPENQGLPAGIYLIINKPQDMSLLQFEKKTGLYLNEVRNYSGDGQTFLLYTEDQLFHQQQQATRRHIFTRTIRPDDGKGLTMN